MAFPYRVYFKEKIDPDVQGSPVLFGVGVSKRYFKKAVDRNRIKRLTRESYRHRQQPIKDLLVGKNAKLDLFFIFTGKEIPDLELCGKGVNTAIEKLLKILSPR
jgi:ribonuclease P protein component